MKVQHSFEMPSAIVKIKIRFLIVHIKTKRENLTAVSCKNKSW